jgi:hypothetical protein
MTTLSPRGTIKTLICGVLLFTAGSACDRRAERPASQPDLPLEGVRLVVGSSAQEWGLLTLPANGGTPDLRPIDRPDEAVWTGSTELPASVEAHSLQDGLAVLRTATGEVFSYDPSADELLRIGSVSEAAEWSSNGSSGLFFARNGDAILEVSRSGSWRWEGAEPIRWAAPIEGGALVLLPADGGTAGLSLLRHGEDRPSAMLVTEAAPPGLVTAWGRRVAFADAAGRNALRILTVEPLELAGRIELGGPILALAASPSSHEIYVSLDSPPRVAAANRFTLEGRDLAHLPQPTTELRSSLFGEALLGRDGLRVQWIPVDGGAAVELDADWRPDLPIGFPGGRVLASRGDEMVLVDVGGRSETVLDAGADRWWLPVRWNPAPRRVVADPVRAERPAGASGKREPRQGGEGPGDQPPPAPAERIPSARPAGDATPQGFYAIVGSARKREGIDELVGSLADAGYPTAVQRLPDDAGRLWYRGLVGPFEARSAADAAARQLLRERRIQAWVTEIAETGSPDQ